MKEHRVLKRYDLELPMLIKGVDAKDNLFEEATKSINISSGGAYFLIINRVKKENRLQAIISLPRKIRNQVDMEGTVVRVENGSNGSNQKKGIALCFNPNKVLEI